MAKEKFKEKLKAVNVSLGVYEKLIEAQTAFSEKNSIDATLVSITNRAILNGLPKVKDNI